MSLWVTIARVAIAVNLLLLLVLGGIWVRNAYQFRSKHTLGLALFSAFLFAENAFAFYFYMLDPILQTWVSTIPVIAQRGMTILRVLETLGLAFLLWATWD